MIAANSAVEAAPAPKNLSSVSKKTSLTEDDSAVIDAFVAVHTDTLTGADASKYVRARQKLLADVTGPSGTRATPMFRETYAEALLPHLQSLIADGSETQAITAAQIAGGLGTDTAVTLLSRRLSPAQEPRVSVRLWTSAALQPLVNQPNVSASRLTRVIQDLERIGVEEPEWAVLRQQLGTLAAAISNTRREDAGRADIAEAGRSAQAAVLAAAINRLKGGDIAMLQVIEPQMQHVQQQFLDQDDSAALSALATTTAPVLGTLYGAILDQWPAITADERSATLAGRALDQGEVMIVLMDNHVTGASNSASPAYEKAIQDGQRPTLEAGQRRWGTLAETAPYGG